VIDAARPAVEGECRPAGVRDRSVFRSTTKACRTQLFLRLTALFEETRWRDGD
jgi:hypothetical protein